MLSGNSVAQTLKVSASAMLLLQIVGNKKYEVGKTSIDNNNTKFDQNQSRDYRVEA
jgi:hypothetical protein